MSTDESLIHGLTLNTVGKAASIGAAKCIDSVPSYFRLAQYPDGSQKVQSGYKWRQGLNFGIEWHVLPLVYVDMEGKELVMGKKNEPS